MVVLQRAVLVAVLVTALAAHALAQHSEHQQFWSGLSQGATIVPCARGTAAMTQAQDALRQFHALVQRLPDTAAIDAPAERLRALLRLPCFRMAFESARVPAPDSVVSLKAWLDAGGDSWLASLLELPELGTVPDLQPHVIVPPDPRPTLAPGRAGHPAALDPWLCAPTDTVCGARTRGWAARAADALDAHWRASRSSDSFGAVGSGPLTRQDIASKCVVEADSDDSGARYEAWRSCIEQDRTIRPVPPLAEFKVPDSGWLTVSGRRGHYDFCDTVHAFNLATGEALLDESCSALALERDGSVNRAATNARRKSRVRTGRVSIDNLREAAWMLLFRSQFTDAQPIADAVPLPRGWTRSWQMRVTPFSFPMRGGGMTGNSGQSRLHWTLAMSGRPTLAGSITWPMSYNGAEDHAMRLLVVAEQSLVDSCVRTRPPALLSTMRVTVVDEGAGDVAEEQATDLADALGRWAALARCR